jgi:hypothetical protein
MAEFRNPSRESREGRRSLVVLMIVLVCVVSGLRRFSATSGTGAVLPQQVQKVRVDVAKGAGPGASGSPTHSANTAAERVALLRTENQ